MSRRVSVVNAKGKILYEGRTVWEAEAFIAGMEQCIPEQVHAGEFSIDASEEADAEYQKGQR